MSQKQVNVQTGYIQEAMESSFHLSYPDINGIYEVYILADFLVFPSGFWKLSSYSKLNFGKTVLVYYCAANLYIESHVIFYLFGKNVGKAIVRTSVVSYDTSI